jgi:RNA polymerase sigma factor (sigma-70 family)
MLIMQPMSANSDASLVTAARGGDRDAYGELFGRYQSRIYNYAYRITGNRDDALDIAQEAFIRVFEALPRVTGDLNFSAYTYRTAHNIAINTVKGRSRFDDSDLLDVQAEPSLRADPEKVALVREQQDQTWGAALKLSDDHRAILTLRELHDLSYQEIAEIMDMPRNTVGVLLGRARLRFKEAFRMSSIDIDTLTRECRDMLPLLSAYLDDELDDKKRARVEAHLEECAFCRLALEEMTESSRSYRALLPLLPPAALGDGLWPRLDGLFRSTGQGSATDGGGSTAGHGSAAGQGSGGAEPGSAPAASTGATEPASLQAPKLMTKGGFHGLKAFASLTGGAVVVAAVILTLALLLGKGGADGDATAGGQLLVSAAVTEVAATTTTTVAPPSGTTTVTTAVTTTAVTAPGTSGITIDAPVTDPPSTSGPPAVTPAGDTTAPAAPGIGYPAEGAIVTVAKITLQWDAVRDPSGVAYTVEVQSFNNRTKEYATSRLVQGITGTELAHEMLSSQQRWRVAAVDGAGNSGEPSAWAAFTLRTIVISPTLSTLPRILPIITTTTSQKVY